MRGNSPVWAQTISDGGSSRRGHVHCTGDTRYDPQHGVPSFDAPARYGFTLNDLGGLRRFVAAAATGAALEQARREDLVLAIDELATNSICHGGGSGSVEIWRERERLVCEVSDAGTLDEPIHGRPLPGPDAVSGRGLWLVEQLTDTVEVRSAPVSGSVVRVSMQLA
jgi:anti-sigma regulatory factor (Ser/Thr protein kinase)